MHSAIYPRGITPVIYLSMRQGAHGSDENGQNHRQDAGATLVSG